MEVENKINYERIGRALKYYKKAGYIYTEVPWVISGDIIKITYPAVEDVVKIEEGYLVGSAEQSFLALYKENPSMFPLGKNFMACTPCFRRLQPDDKFHQLYFMKVELFSVGENFEKIFKDALNFINEEIVRTKEFHFPYIMKTNDSFMSQDILVGGIEVGSYGIRDSDELKLTWTYGTGLAEPRFSQSLKIEKDNEKT